MIGLLTKTKTVLKMKMIEIKYNWAVEQKIKFWIQNKSISKSQKIKTYNKEKKFSVSKFSPNKNQKLKNWIKKSERDFQTCRICTNTTTCCWVTLEFWKRRVWSSEMSQTNRMTFRRRRGVRRAANRRPYRQPAKV